MIIDFDNLMILSLSLIPRRKLSQPKRQSYMMDSFNPFNGVIWGSYSDSGKENGNYFNHIRIVEKNMETTLMGLYRAYIRIVEKKLETTLMGLYRL